MTVRWLGQAAPVFPFPEGVQALVDEALGRPGLYAALPQRPGLRVAAAPHCVWNAALMNTFAAAVTTPPARLEIACNPMTLLGASLGGAPLSADGRAHVYDIFLEAADAPETTLEELRARAQVVRLTLPCEVLPIRTPGYGPAPHMMPLPQCAAWAAHVTRWPHLLWLLQGAPAALRAGHLGNVLGKGVRIHRTALVESSVLGDGVDVDAHATILGSVLGKDVRVGDHTAIHHSVIGPNCQTLADSFFRRVVALPGSTLSNLDLSEVILGRQVFITAGVIFFRGAPGVTVRVGQDTLQEEDSGRPELGGAVGHRCVLGTRAIFTPGRAVPGGTVIVMRPDEGVMHPDPTTIPGEPLAWDNAQLVSVARRWPGYRPDELD